MCFHGTSWWSRGRTVGPLKWSGGRFNSCWYHGGRVDTWRERSVLDSFQSPDRGRDFVSDGLRTQDPKEVRTRVSVIETYDCSNLTPVSPYNLRNLAIHYKWVRTTPSFIIREKVMFIIHPVIKRELNRSPIYECRCDEGLKAKVEGSTHLGYTGLRGGLEHLNIEVR